MRNSYLSSSSDSAAVEHSPQIAPEAGLRKGFLRFLVAQSSFANITGALDHCD